MARNMPSIIAISFQLPGQIAYGEKNAVAALWIVVEKIK
jgi:hypothetical protein